MVPCQLAQPATLLFQLACTVHQQHQRHQDAHSRARPNPPPLSDCLRVSARTPPPQYFPTFDELPLMDEYVDPNYYADVGGGTMLPIKHW